MALRFWLLFSIIYVFSPYVVAQKAPESFQQCIACHGNKAQGNSSLNAPVLAGQYEWYLHRQLTNFSNGLRGANSSDNSGQQMAGIAKQLSSSNITLLANYLANLPVVEINNNIEGSLKNGSRYYQAKCGACHGGNAQGNKAFNAPRLAQQNYDYLFKQMKNFQQGKRGIKKQDKYGRQMAMMAKTVSDKELHDILYFIVQQPIKSKRD